MIRLEVEKDVVEDAFVLKMRVIEVTTELPPEVFVWQNQGDGSQCFSHVASVADMTSFDVETAIGTSYFRLENMEQKFVSVAQLEECFESYKESIAELEVDFLNSTTELGFGDPFEITLNEDLE